MFLYQIKRSSTNSSKHPFCAHEGLAIIAPKTITVSVLTLRKIAEMVLVTLWVSLMEELLRCEAHREVKMVIHRMWQLTFLRLVRRTTSLSNLKPMRR
ncbi:hypothetical protein A4A49_38515 [Nicotiana attenuata]|uniref:Uncharacterized protein n=1 Tax=Nicotiana attenuata TaxID=49451 RepID=A0A1J6I5B0_NICAT|nr:hypothetical protein A4A49_38515 [Nicotiana attenuata]